MQLGTIEALTDSLCMLLAGSKAVGRGLPAKWPSRPACCRGRTPGQLHARLLAMAGTGLPAQALSAASSAALLAGGQWPGPEAGLL